MSLALATTDPLAAFGHTMGLVVTAVGAIFLAGAVLIVVASRWAHRRGVRTTGTIVGYSYGQRRAIARGAFVQAPDPLGGGDVVAMDTMERASFPVVEFQTATGAPVRASARNGSSPRPGKVGDPITVFYNPSRPESFWAETSRSRGVNGCGVLLLGGVGVLALVVGIALLGS